MWNVDNWGVIKEGYIKNIPLETINEQARENPTGKTQALIYILTEGGAPILVYKKMNDFFKKLKLTYYFTCEDQGVNGVYTSDNNIQMIPLDAEEVEESNFDYPDYD